MEGSRYTRVRCNLRFHFVGSRLLAGFFFRPACAVSRGLTFSRPPTADGPRTGRQRSRAIRGLCSRVYWCNGEPGSGEKEIGGCGVQPVAGPGRPGTGEHDEEDADGRPPGPARDESVSEPPPGTLKDSGPKERGQPGRRKCAPRFFPSREDHLTIPIVRHPVLVYDELPREEQQEEKEKEKAEGDRRGEKRTVSEAKSVVTKEREEKEEEEVEAEEENRRG